MNTMRSPLVLVLVNFIVGMFVSKGIIEPNDHETLVGILSDLAGIIIILLTTIVSLYKVIKHKHSDEQPVVTGASITTGQQETLQELLRALSAGGSTTVTTLPSTASVSDTGTPDEVPIISESPTSPITEQLNNPKTVVN